MLALRVGMWIGGGRGAAISLASSGGCNARPLTAGGTYGRVGALSAASPEALTDPATSGPAPRAASFGRRS